MVTRAPADRPSAPTCPIPPTAGLIGFTATWLGAAVVSSIPLVFLADPDDELPIPVLAISLLLGWAAFLIGSTLTSRRHGSGDVRADLGIVVRPIDAIGVPIGITAQVALIPLVYFPLRAVWPETFDDEALTETAKDLVDRADGLLLPLLILLVVVGAPVVEEIFYRGLLQRPLLSDFPAPAVILGVAAVFSIIHFRPVEYPGLFVAGLVFGVAAWKTGRVGMAIAAHVGFNLTGVLSAL